jgi:biotin synthase
MQIDDVLEAAKRAKAAGSTRFCMGTAWRGPSQVGKGQFDRVLKMTSEVRDMGMEVCATLGMLNHDQAKALREAGLTAYNHNLDTSPEFYPKVTSSRRYEDRLNTIAAVRDAGISVCCGGILGLGEDERDRASLLRVLANLPEHPESVPINALVPVKGTPLQDLEPPSGLEMARAVAVARIVMPKTVVRLSAGRVRMSATDQAMCFLAGANSVFTGDTLLTTPNNEASEDSKLMAELGLVGRPAFEPYLAGARPSDGSEFPSVGAVHPAKARRERERRRRRRKTRKRRRRDDIRTPRVRLCPATMSRPLCSETQKCSTRVSSVRARESSLSASIVLEQRLEKKNPRPLFFGFASTCRIASSRRVSGLSLASRSWPGFGVRFLASVVGVRPVESAPACTDEHTRARWLSCFAAHAPPAC